MPQIHKSSRIPSELSATEYDTLRIYSSHDRRGTKTNFESHRHVDLAMFKYHMRHGFPCRSVNVSDLHKSFPVTTDNAGDVFWLRISAATTY